MLRRALVSGLMVLWLGATPTAGPISIDPGAAGSGFSYRALDFSDLAGTPLNGQTHSLDIVFKDSKFLVDMTLSIELFLNQTGDLGTSPATGYAVSGYLLNSAGGALGSSASFILNTQMPAQIWPGWPFTLAGQPLLPATVGFGLRPSGAMVDNIPGPDYSIDPLVFYGIHFDLQLPSSPGSTLIGSRLQFANFDSPILLSPDPIPQYTVRVPDSGSTLFSLGMGLVGLRAWRKWLG